MALGSQCRSVLACHCMPVLRSHSQAQSDVQQYKANKKTHTHMHTHAHRFPLQGTPIRYHRCCQKKKDDDFNYTYETFFCLLWFGASIILSQFASCPLYSTCISSPFHFQQMLCRATFTKESEGFYEKFQGSVRKMNIESPGFIDM